jgi:hypothetical protein
MGDYLLKEVTDAEGEAFPAEVGSGNEVKGRLPVEGELEGDLLEAVLETELGTYAGPELGGGVAVSILNAGKADVGLGTSIEVEGTHRANLEVVGGTYIESTNAPTEINFSEVGGTKGVLVRYFCTVTGTDTDGARLCGGHYGQTQDSCHYK